MLQSNGPADDVARDSIFKTIAVRQAYSYDCRTTLGLLNFLFIN